MGNEDIVIFLPKNFFVLIALIFIGYNGLFTYLSVSPANVLRGYHVHILFSGS